jgi:hypothetical protein
VSQSARVCPFCHEVFDNAETCPIHDLPLVREQELHAKAVDEDDDGEDERVDFYDLVGGRSFLHGAGVLLLFGFALPFVSGQKGEEFVLETPFELALQGAVNLWMIPLVAFALFGVLATRRTPTQMRGARLAVVFLAFFPVAAIAFSIYRVFLVAEIQTPGVLIRVEYGTYIYGVASLFILLGGIRFGGTAPVPPPPDRLPQRESQDRDKIEID